MSQQIVDMSDAPFFEYMGEYVRALAITAVMHRADGTFVSLCDSEGLVRLKVPMVIEVGDYLIQDADGRQAAVRGQHFEDAAAPVASDDIIDPGELIHVGELPDRVTLDDIEEAIDDVSFYHLGETLTVCVLTLDNGFTVTGESACVDPAKFDAEYGEYLARENAVEKCWPLFGFMLAELRYRRLAQAEEA